MTEDATGEAASSDDFKLTNLKIGGSLSIQLSDGASSLDIDNLKVGASVTIDTRGGGDDVLIEGDGNFGISAFRKRTTFLLGAGDDSLVVGEDSEDNRVRFFGKVRADGGDGTDTRNGIALDNEFIGSATYIESAFEILLPPEP